MTTIWTALASLKDVCRLSDVKIALYQVTSTDTRMQTTHKGEKRDNTTPTNLPPN